MENDFYVKIFLQITDFKRLSLKFAMKHLSEWVSGVAENVDIQKLTVKHIGLSEFIIMNNLNDD